MFLKKRLLLILNLILLIFSQLLHAETGVSGAGILLQEGSTRQAALGGSGVAWRNSADLILANPAGLSFLDINEFKLTHMAGIEGLSTDMIIAGLPFEKGGGIGFQVVYRTMPTIANEFAQDPPVDSHDLVFGAATGIKFSEKLSLGVQIKIISLTLGPTDTANLAFDIGGQYQLNEHWHFGLAVQHLSNDIKWSTDSDPTPLTMALGVHTILLDQDKYLWQAGLDTRYLIPEQMMSLHAGSELVVQDRLAFRLGVKLATETMTAAMTGGVGFKFKIYRIKMGLDYAFIPEFWGDTDMALKNIISLSVLF